MKTAKEVILAVQNGDSVSEEEMKYAVVAMNYILQSNYFDIANAITDTEDAKLEGKGFSRLKAAFNRYGSLDKDLDKLIRGSSFEPGISPEEKRKRFVDATASTGAKLFESLTALAKK